MTHDSFCLATARSSSWEPEMCICDVIAKVREDERRKALGIRVREVTPYANGYIEGEDHMLAKCIAAVESLPGLFTRRQEVMDALRALQEKP